MVAGAQRRDPPCRGGPLRRPPCIRARGCLDRAVVEALDGPSEPRRRARRHGTRPRLGGVGTRRALVECWRIRRDSPATAPRRPLDDSLDPKGEKGPTGSVRMELQLANQGGPVAGIMMTVERFIKRDAGCNPSTATPSSSTLSPTALRMRKTRYGKKSSAGLTVFVKRRAASGIPGITLQKRYAVPGQKQTGWHRVPRQGGVPA